MVCLCVVIWWASTVVNDGAVVKDPDVSLSLSRKFLPEPKEWYLKDVVGSSHHGKLGAMSSRVRGFQINLC